MGFKNALVVHVHDVLQILKFGIDVPCIVQWADTDLVSEGRMLGTCGRSTDVALESALKSPTPNTFFLMTIFLDCSCFRPWLQR